MMTILVATLLLLGSLFVLAAGLGIFRMPDVLIRMHASTKAGTLGAGLILGAVAVHFGDLTTVSIAGLTILFLLVTAPVAAHMIGRAAYRTGVPLWERMVLDEGPCGQADQTNAGDRHSP